MRPEAAADAGRTARPRRHRVGRAARRHSGPSASRVPGTSVKPYVERSTDGGGRQVVDELGSERHELDVAAAEWTSPGGERHGGDGSQRASLRLDIVRADPIRQGDDPATRRQRVRQTTRSCRRIRTASAVLHEREYRVRAYRLDDADGRAAVAPRRGPRPEAGRAVRRERSRPADDPSHAGRARGQLPEPWRSRAAAVLFEAHPHDACGSIAPHYGELVGLSIARGFTHEVRQRFGGPRGCTHTTALLLAMAPVAIQCIWSMQVVDDREAGRPWRRPRRSATRGAPAAMGGDA